MRGVHLPCVLQLGLVYRLSRTTQWRRKSCPTGRARAVQNFPTVVFLWGLEACTKHGLGNVCRLHSFSSENHKIFRQTSNCKGPLRPRRHWYDCSFWCTPCSQKSLQDVLQHLWANSEQEKCFYELITSTRMKGCMRQSYHLVLDVWETWELGYIKVDERTSSSILRKWFLSPRRGSNRNLLMTSKTL